jgi:hypothetical protein
MIFQGDTVSRVSTYLEETENETPSLEVMKFGHYSHTKVVAYGK